jgi:RNA polymerase sigma-70 factor (ECF subfamily)
MMAHASVQLVIERSGGNWPSPVCHTEMGKCGDAVPDEELVERSLKGEEEAFRHLYERYQRLVYAAVCRILPDPEEARDATQDIFILVYRSLRFWSPQRARFSPWIHRVATNHAIDRWRSRRRRAELQMIEAWESDSRSASTGHAAIRSVDNALEQMEQSARVSRILDRLPELQRRFIVLRYCEGLKLREIAEKEGFKLGTVKSTLHRATETMRCKMKCFYN